jgi:hypothetical protein
LAGRWHVFFFPNRLAKQVIALYSLFFKDYITSLA